MLANRIEITLEGKATMKLTLLWIPLFIISMAGFANNPTVTLNNPDNGQAVVKQLPQDVSEATNLKSAVKDWISALTKEAAFDAWKTAKWESLPVGPGTHSWLIILRKEQLEVGYMIVGAMEDGKHYKLLEYGLGPQPLFSLNTLYQSLMQQALIDPFVSLTAFMQDVKWTKKRFYVSTLENFWQITHGTEIYYLDAKSGELLLDPIDPFDQPAQSSSSSDHNGQSAFGEVTNLKSGPSSDQLKESIVTSSYDPFEKLSWITGKPLAIHSLTDLKLALQAHSEITFMSKLYHQKLIHPFAVIGYQLWSGGQTYIALDDEGARYIPLVSLVEIGAFYP
jgi:hypothetical protein